EAAALDEHRRVVGAEAAGGRVHDVDGGGGGAEVHHYQRRAGGGALGRLAADKGGASVEYEVGGGAAGDRADLAGVALLHDEGDARQRGGEVGGAVGGADMVENQHVAVGRRGVVTPVGRGGE